MNSETIKYFFKEAFGGILKNKFMSFASVTVVSACLFVVIIFMCITSNIGVALKQIEDNVGIEIFLGDDPSETQVEGLIKKIKNIPHVTDVVYVSAEDNLKEAEKMWDKGTLEGLENDNPFPRSIKVTVENISYRAEVIKSVEKLRDEFEVYVTTTQKVIPTTTETTTQTTTETTTETTTQTTTETTTQTTTLSRRGYRIKDNSLSGQAVKAPESTTEATTVQTTTVKKAEVPVIMKEARTETTTNDLPKIGEEGYSYRGIEYIQSAKKLTNTLVNLNTVVNMVSVVLILILTLISVFIIVNTVKLTVMVRKEEIFIMKYIGATNMFVRTPFIIEGVIIGILGSIVPCLVCTLAYGKIFALYDTTTVASLIKLIPTSVLMGRIIPFSVVFAIAIGIVGSASSVRKYLKA